MAIKTISTVVAALAISLTAGALLHGSPIAAELALGSEQVRCGIQFESDDYLVAQVAHLALGSDGSESLTIERKSQTRDGQATPIVMHFDQPVDYIDFLVGHGEVRSLQATLVALDANGRVVDTDRGRVTADSLSTMQVTADAEVIREARLVIEGSPAIGYIVDLEVGSGLSFCAARS